MYCISVEYIKQCGTKIDNNSLEIVIFASEKILFKKKRRKF